MNLNFATDLDLNPTDAAREIYMTVDEFMSAKYSGLRPAIRIAIGLRASKISRAFDVEIKKVSRLIDNGGNEFYPTTINAYKVNVLVAAATMEGY